MLLCQGGKYGDESTEIFAGEAKTSTEGLEDDQTFFNGPGRYLRSRGET